MTFENMNIYGVQKPETIIHFDNNVEGNEVINLVLKIINAELSQSFREGNFIIIPTEYRKRLERLVRKERIEKVLNYEN
jgi:hypothetical protein